jgi:hypothetical protein
MSLFIIAGCALIALQFTSGIGQWISEHQKATATVSWLQWFVTKIGLAPTIITTRVLVIAVFVVLYLLQLHFIVWLVFAATAWYLYKTGKYLALWHAISTEATSVVDNNAGTIVNDIVQDVTKPAPAPQASAQAAAQAAQATSAGAPSAAAYAAAAQGVDVSKMP